MPNLLNHLAAPSCTRLGSYWDRCGAHYLEPAPGARQPFRIARPRWRRLRGGVLLKRAAMSAIGGNPENMCSLRVFLSLTPQPDVGFLAVSSDTPDSQLTLAS